MTTITNGLRKYLIAKDITWWQEQYYDRHRTMIGFAIQNTKEIRRCFASIESDISKRTEGLDLGISFDLKDIVAFWVMDIILDTGNVPTYKRRRDYINNLLDF